MANQYICAPYREKMIDFIKGHIYVMSKDQDSESLEGNLLLLTDFDSSYVMDDGSFPLEFDGWLSFPHVNENNKVWGGWGGYSCDILMDYTEYLRKRNAARKIQSQWRLYKRKCAAVKRIEKAFLSWKARKVYWSPYTFAGIADLFVEYVKLKKSLQL